MFKKQQQQYPSLCRLVPLFIQGKLNLGAYLDEKKTIAVSFYMTSPLSDNLKFIGFVEGFHPISNNG